MLRGAHVFVPGKPKSCHSASSWSALAWASIGCHTPAHHKPYALHTVHPPLHTLNISLQKLLQPQHAGRGSWGELGKVGNNPSGFADVSKPCKGAGVMACSQEVHKGDLVAVSVAMGAPGSEGYITRGSIVGPDLPAVASLYIGKSL